MRDWFYDLQDMSLSCFRSPKSPEQICKCCGNNVLNNGGILKIGIVVPAYDIDHAFQILLAMQKHLNILNGHKLNRDSICLV